jgi:hypothetical protein
MNSRTGQRPTQPEDNPMTEAQALKTARAEVAKHSFGTTQWEAAMQVVRAMVQAQIEQAPRFVHASVDGDIWSVGSEG